MKNPKQTWIIGLSGSEWDDVVTYRVTGTKAQVKRHLAGIVKQDKKESSTFDYGDDTVKKVREMADGRLYAGTTYNQCHADYTATPEMEPVTL